MNAGTHNKRSRLVWPSVAGIIAGAVGAVVMIVSENRGHDLLVLLAEMYGIVAFCVGVIVIVGALVVRLVDGRDGRLDVIRALVLGACLAGSTAVSYGVADSLMVDCEDLTTQGATLVAAVEAHHERTGAYPDDLGEVADVPVTPFGPWSYVVNEQGYILRVGHHGGRLRVRYSSDERRWDCSAD